MNIYVYETPRSEKLIYFVFFINILENRIMIIYSINQNTHLYCNFMEITIYSRNIF